MLAAALGLMLLACGPLALPFLPATPTATPLPGLEFMLTPTGQAPVSPTATGPSIPLPTPLPTPTDQPTPTPDAPWFTGEIRVFPGPLHYTGDILTVEVAVGNLGKLPDSGVVLQVDGAPSEVKPFPYYSPLRDDVLVFRWAWDTTGKSGLHELKVIIPGQQGAEPAVLVSHVNLLPSTDRPAQEQGARWAVRNTACCQIAYVTGTAAARDIASIDDRANQAAQVVERRTGFPISGRPIPLVMIDNVWGNGAYASNNVVISYVDRAYLSLNLDSVLRHEFTHWVLGPLTKETPVILVEGAAVFISGGHYKVEPLPERGAALLSEGLYIPLADLADHFRARQHEVAYAEAGALVDYLVETYSWAKFVNVYSSDKLGGDGAQWLNNAFKAHYQKSLDDVEAGFKAWLNQHNPGSQAADLRLTIALMDTVRDYQARYDSYEESLPSIDEAMKQGAVSEFVREPTDPENIALEAMLITVGEYQRAANYADANSLIKTVKATLTGSAPPDPAAADYLSIARAVTAAGYEAQRIDIQGDSATVTAIRVWPTLETLKLARVGGEWLLQPGQ